MLKDTCLYVFPADFRKFVVFVHILGIIKLEHMVAQEGGKFQVCGSASD
jgi:hypothetical protein